jgi:hypothetical protein
MTSEKKRCLWGKLNQRVTTTHTFRISNIFQLNQRVTSEGEKENGQTIQHSERKERIYPEVI